MSKYINIVLLSFFGVLSIKFNMGLSFYIPFVIYYAYKNIKNIILISIIIVYFSMRSYAMKNIYDIGVYRAIGIKKSSVVNIYLIQILIISLKTTLVGGLLCFAVTNIIGSVPVLDDSISISFGLFLICTFGLMAINILIGILPILKYLSLTPTKILTKYDI